MRALSLFLFGLKADLPSTLKGLVRLTQARAALADLSARFGEFSFPLTLPATRDNARIFGVGGLHPLGLDKFRRVDYPFELRCGGEILFGTFRLTSMRNGYTGNLIGAGSGWAVGIGEKKLPDLQLAPIAYDGSQLEAILALDCDTSDVQFPLLSFGNYFAPPQLATQPDGSQEEQSLPAQALIGHPLSADDYAPSVYYPTYRGPPSPMRAGRSPAACSMSRSGARRSSPRPARTWTRPGPGARCCRPQPIMAGRPCGPTAITMPTRWAPAASTAIRPWAGTRPARYASCRCPRPAS